MRLLQGEQLNTLGKLTYKLDDPMLKYLSDIESKHNEGKNTISISPKIEEHLKTIRQQLDEIRIQTTNIELNDRAVTSDIQLRRQALESIITDQHTSLKEILKMLKQIALDVEKMALLYSTSQSGTERTVTQAIGMNAQIIDGISNELEKIIVDVEKP